MKITKSELRKVIKEIVRQPELKEELETILLSEAAQGAAALGAVAKIGNAIKTVGKAIYTGIQTAGTAAIITTDVIDMMLPPAGGGTINPDE
tara:strand:+ start:1980 stop:2255 length:276 start_codon:yes stop_codon:yes gene_type:complete